MFKSRSKKLEQFLSNQPESLKYAKKINWAINDLPATIEIIRAVAKIRSNGSDFKSQSAELKAASEKIAKEKLPAINWFKRLLVGSDLKYNIAILGYTAPKLMEGQIQEVDANIGDLTNSVPSTKATVCVRGMKG